MGTFSIWHWLIVLAVVLILFGGGGKLSRLMGDFGKGLRSFKEGVKSPEDPDEDEADTIEAAPTKKATPKKVAKKKAAPKKTAKKKSSAKKAAKKKA